MRISFSRRYWCGFPKRVLAAREVFWVLRQKTNMLCEVVEGRETSGDVLSDETVRLAAEDTAAKYPETLRRVRAVVEVGGERREMVFLTNNAKWAASTICELYRARWEIEVFFKEIKQTLSRLVGIVRAAVWMDVGIVETLRLYGTASPPLFPKSEIWYNPYRFHLMMPTPGKARPNKATHRKALARDEFIIMKMKQ